MTLLNAVRPMLGPVRAWLSLCDACEAREQGFCALLPPDVLADVADAAQRMAFAPRAALFRQGEAATGIFILRNGTVRLMQLLPDGRQASVGFRFGGDLLGFSPQREHRHGAEALDSVSACRIGRSELDRLFRRHPILERTLLHLCACELAAAQDQLVALVRFTAEERVAAFLLSIVEARECRGHPGPIYELRATRADVGELLGLSLETVSRAVSGFRRRGWLRGPGPQTFELLDRDALTKLASGNADA